MDDIVRRAMARWPNVPAVCGWLRLDRRGNWSLRLSEEEPARFDRVINPALIDFIGRNYGNEAAGRHYFQNGPQRVYAALDYTPWIARLADTGDALITHTEMQVTSWFETFVDEDGALVLATNLGAALLIDRDLPRAVDTLVDANGEAIDAESFFDRIAAGGVEDASMLGQVRRFSSIRSAELETRFRFVRAPSL